MPEMPVSLPDTVVLRSDLRLVRQSIAETRPEPGFSADPATVRQAYEYMAEQMQARMAPDDDRWIDGVLRYIADKPWRWASTCRPRRPSRRPARAGAPPHAYCRGPVPANGGNA